MLRGPARQPDCATSFLCPRRTALNLYLERKGGPFLSVGNGPSDTHPAGGPQHDPLTPRERAEFIAVGGRPFQPSGSGPTNAIGQPPHASRCAFDMCYCSWSFSLDDIDC
jgi:hypothetical protein